MEDMIERDCEEDAWSEVGESPAQEEVDAGGDDRHVSVKAEVADPQQTSRDIRPFK